LKNNSKINDINNLTYELRRQGYYWSNIIDKKNSDENFLSIHKLEPFAEAPAHIHENEEIIFVIEGKIEINLKNQSFNLSTNQICQIPANTQHSLKNITKTNSKIMVIFGNNDPFSKTSYIKNS
tara:strand:- start:910 stop:1281 length:372 start_codon:yes stop_codon:yes gene_type:complete